MRVAVRFQDETLDLDISEERLLAAWHGPAGVSASEVGRLVRDALEHPRGFPPLREAVVPGDRVVLAYDPEIPEGRAVLEAICGVLRDSGVDDGGITVLVPRGLGGEAQGRDLPAGVVLAVHDPQDRTQLAYLSTTATESMNPAASATMVSSVSMLHRARHVTAAAPRMFAPAARKAKPSSG